MRKWIIGAMLLLLAVGLYWRLRPRAPVLAEAFVGEADATVWSTTAQVRENVASLHWGDRVDVLARSSAQEQIRTHQGVVGWMESHSLLDKEVWQQEQHLLSSVRGMPLQGAGHTKVYSNIRIEPGRDAQRIYQFPGDIPLAIFGRKSLPGAQSESASDAPAQPEKREEWLLVYGPSPHSAIAAGATPSTLAAAAPTDEQAETDLVTGNTVPGMDSGTSGKQTSPAVAGWVLARFIEFDLPETLRDYASSSGVRPVAWFVLNRVPDPGGARAQYLLAAMKGSEPQSCDFNSLRAYTWDHARQQYQTAYVEGNLCGYLPVRIGKQAVTGDPEFRFKGVSSDGASDEWLYRMKQTTVRRVREGETVRKSRR
jgi:hypothetical protein